jgi:TatD DNase family protein
MKMVDTHCHIHDSEFAVKSEFSQQEIIDRATSAGIDKLICVGTSLKSSFEAKDFAQINENCYFSIALHPHEAETYSVGELQEQMSELEKIVEGQPKRFVAIGECGLDYFYHDNKKVIEKQEKLFISHIELAVRLNKPIIFHIRDAFDDFFRIIDKYPKVNGVVHSFSATSKELEGVLSRGFYVGLNGIMTFTKNQKQLDAAIKIPVDRILIETDAPFLTPVPLRGKINEPKNVINITQFISELRGESQAFLAKQTSENAKKLFNL